MNSRILRIAVALAVLFPLAGLNAHAQAKGAPPPPPPPPPGAPAGPPPSGPPPANAGGNPPRGGQRPGSPSGGTHTAAQFGPVGRWWDNKSVVQTIGLRSDQQKKMDVVFNANKPAILNSYKTLLKEQANLDALSKKPQVDQASMFAAIDAVSQARASLQKATTQMLLQVRQLMDPDQIAKLEKLQ
jgi:Spy/CpxP family protein refolding chaperone